MSNPVRVTVTGAAGQIGYSLVFVLLMGVLVLLQSGALSFMVP